jgi:GntR family transcriptional repressor for pyruvate dehydrogenase complex
MKIIVPDIIGHFNKEHICDRTHANNLIDEHLNILEGIKSGDVKTASEALETHFIALREYIKK